MSREAPVSCIICDKSLDNVEETAENQPYGGTAFVTHGHYGSTSFDPFNGSMLEINICDKCLTKKGKEGKVLWRREANALVKDGSIFGWIENPTPYVMWNPDLDKNDGEGDTHDYSGKAQTDLVKIEVNSHQELLDLVEEHGIRLYGGVKLNGHWTPEEMTWLDDDEIT